MQQEVVRAMSSTARRAFLASLIVVGLIASCTSSPSSTPATSVCDGISAEMGGCTSARYRFSADTCEGLAREWATVLDGQVLAILDGSPDTAQAVSVRLKQAVVVATTDMNTRLRSLGLAETCDVPAFMAAAEPLLSAELRQKVGAGLYDGNPAATYEEWIADVERTVAVIDAGESPTPS